MNFIIASSKFPPFVRRLNRYQHPCSGYLATRRGGKELASVSYFLTVTSVASLRHRWQTRAGGETVDAASVRSSSEGY